MSNPNKDKTREEVLKDEIEPEQTVVPEPKVEEKVDPTPEPSRVLLSSEDAYVFDRMKSQPTSLDDVELKVLERVQEGDKHQLSLPEELEKYESRFAFRWLFKRKKAIDYALDVRGWTLVKRQYFRDVPDHLFTVSGSIERGDSILAFIPIKKAEEIRKEPGEISNQVKQAYFDKHKEDPRFYAPSGGPNEDGKQDKVVMI